MTTCYSHECWLRSISTQKAAVVAAERTATRRARRMILAGLIAFLFTLGAAIGESKRIPKVTGPRTTQTDSWICQNVSAFFCFGQVPKIVSKPHTVPSKRGRNE